MRRPLGPLLGFWNGCTRAGHGLLFGVKTQLFAAHNNLSLHAAVTRALLLYACVDVSALSSYGEAG